MAWITQEKTFTSTVEGNLEDAVQFQGAGKSSNVVFRVEAPSASAAKGFQVRGSLNGTDWTAKTTDPLVGGVVDFGTFTTEGGRTAVGMVVYPFYQVTTLTETHPVTFTIIMSEEI